MTIQNMTQLLKHARENYYAIPSFDLLNLDIIKPVIKIAEKYKAPVIIATLERGLKSTGIKQFSSAVRLWGESVYVPVVLHLDHGNNFEILKESLDAGFTSVMIDGSHFPLEENIDLVIKAKEIAKPYNASIEAELGRVPGIEAGEEVKEEEEELTDIQEAIKFCESTKVDALAVSIGTLHFYQTKLLNPNIRLLKELRAKLNTPLVLHGGASVTDFKVVELVKSGITKYNINYKVNKPFVDGLIHALATLKEEVSPGRFSIHPEQIVESGQQRVANLTLQYLELLDTIGKANSYYKWVKERSK